MSNDKLNELFDTARDLDRKDFDGIIKAYTKIIEFPNTNLYKDSAYIECALAYYGKGDFNTAIEYLSKAIEISPNFGRAYWVRGAMYYEAGMREQALADFDSMKLFNPNEDTISFNFRGCLYSENAEYDKAVKYFTRAIRLDSDFAKAFYNRGEAYKELMKYDEAIADFDKAIELDSNLVGAIHSKGIVQAFKYASAIEEKLRQKIDDKLHDYEVDIQQAGGYKAKEKQYDEEFTRLTVKRDRVLGALSTFAFMGYGAISVMIIFEFSVGWFNTDYDIVHLSQIIPLTLLVTLILSLPIWTIRLINKDRDRIWALREDAYTKGILSTLIDLDIDARPNMIKRFFDHFSNHSSVNIIFGKFSRSTNSEFVNPLLKRDDDDDLDENRGGRL